MRSETITSARNPKIKQLLALGEKSSLRRESGLFVLEGLRELLHALEAGFEVDTIFFCPEIAGNALGQGNPALRDARWVEVSRDIYEKIAYRGSTEGVIAEVKTRSMSLGDLRISGKPLVVVLESVEKPGNLGAVLRSADAAAADAVLICDPRTDLFNPNLIRASIGAVFTVPVVACESAEAIKWLKSNNIKILTAQLQDSEWYYDTDMRDGTAIVIGTEATGLTEVWRKAADAHIRIPMLGRLDSLNASVSAAVLLFEAVRQRQ